MFLTISISSFLRRRLSTSLNSTSSSDRSSVIWLSVLIVPGKPIFFAISEISNVLCSFSRVRLFALVVRLLCATLNWFN